MMINEAIEWLRTEYGSNDFLVGTTIPFVIGAVVYGIRNTIFSIYGHILKYFTVHIRINSDQPYYHKVSKYIFTNYIWGVFKRNYILTNLYSNDDYVHEDDDEEDSNADILTATSGYGKSLAIFNGYPGFVTISSETTQSIKFKEYLEMSILTFSPTKTSETICRQINDYINIVKTKNVLRVRVYSGDNILSSIEKPKRSLSSIFIPQETKDRIMNTLIEFNKSEKEYIERGIPYHIGIILSGPPGTGKTSLIHAIASELNLDIHYHTGSLSSTDIDPKQSIFVLEDFDASGIRTSVRSSDSKNDNNDAALFGPTLSETLNFLDGFLTPSGLIVIATTNHIDKLDPAIIRPGRFDLIEELGYMREKEYLEMCKFYDVEPLKDFESKSPAELMVDIKEKWGIKKKEQNVITLKKEETT